MYISARLTGVAIVCGRSERAAVHARFKYRVPKWHIAERVPGPAVQALEVVPVRLIGGACRSTRFSCAVQVRKLFWTGNTLFAVPEWMINVLYVGAGPAESIFFDWRRVRTGAYALGLASRSVVYFQFVFAARDAVLPVLVQKEVVSTS